jgi:hypothetical protein
MQVRYIVEDDLGSKEKKLQLKMKRSRIEECHGKNPIRCRSSTDCRTAVLPGIDKGHSSVVEKAEPSAQTAACAPIAPSMVTRRAGACEGVGVVAAHDDVHCTTGGTSSAQCCLKTVHHSYKYRLCK